MAEYLAPGVYIEETSFRQSTIEGVSTSVAGIVGPTRYGPVRGRPLLVTSIAEFENYFGDLSDLSLGGTDGRNYTALGARAFFDNGGKQLYVARISRDVAETGDPAQRASHGVLAARVAGADAASAAPITFEARFPGGGGNLDVVMRPRPGASRLTMARSTDDADDLLLRLTNVTKAQLVAPAAAVPDAQFPLRRLVALASISRRQMARPSNMRSMPGRRSITSIAAGRCISSIPARSRTVSPWTMRAAPLRARGRSRRLTRRLAPRPSMPCRVVRCSRNILASRHRLRGFTPRAMQVGRSLSPRR